MQAPLDTGRFQLRAGWRERPRRTMTCADATVRAKLKGGGLRAIVSRVSATPFRAASAIEQPVSDRCSMAVRRLRISFHA